jgi:predicted glycoside hydrolase/deacetylase ChbG (UPF0249 family)
MKRLIVNADDFGRSSEINAGIIEGHQKGIVTSASLMTSRDAFDEAVGLARKNPDLGVGLHLDLDAFFEVQHGSGRLLHYKDAKMPMSALIEETEKQMKAILQTGLPIRHLDGHHHVHLRPELFAMVAAMTAKYKIPVIRYFKGFYDGLYPGASMAWAKDLVSRFGLRCVDTFFAGWEPVASSLPGYSYFDLGQPFESAELMVHPGKKETWREQELSHCVSPEVRRRLKEANVTLARFDQLP